MDVEGGMDVGAFHRKFSLFSNFVMSDSVSSVKVAIVGNAGVGKTCLIYRYQSKTFSNTTTSTMGVDFFSVPIEHEGKKFAIQIWDTAGQERFRALSEQYLKGCDGIIMVYDIASFDSFSGTDGWFRKIDKSQHILRNNCLMLLGNKGDLDHIREVEVTDGEKLADTHDNVKVFFEVSAKTGENVDKAFTKFGHVLCENYMKGRKEEDIEKVNLRKGGEDGGCPC